MPEPEIISNNWEAAVHILGRLGGIAGFIAFWLLFFGFLAYYTSGADEKWMRFGKKYMLIALVFLIISVGISFVGWYLSLDLNS
jgi:hypothetical protein